MIKQKHYGVLMEVYVKLQMDTLQQMIQGYGLVAIKQILGYYMHQMIIVVDYF